MKIYKAKRNTFTSIMLSGVLCVPLIVYLLDPNTFSKKPFILLPLIGPFLLTLWIILSTFYKIENTYFYYRSAFLRGKIKISDITEILPDKTLKVGIKPALASKGMILKFNLCDEIYIAPENNNVLIADLLKINPNIKITR